MGTPTRYKSRASHFLRIISRVNQKDVLDGEKKVRVITERKGESGLKTLVVCKLLYPFFRPVSEYDLFHNFLSLLKWIR